MSTTLVPQILDITMDPELFWWTYVLDILRPSDSLKSTDYLIVKTVVNADQTANPHNTSQLTQYKLGVGWKAILWSESGKQQQIC